MPATSTITNRRASSRASWSRRSGLRGVFFCNSGAEANEAAFKLARKRAFRNGEPLRTTILACSGSFHGRTLGALAATANPHYREGFGTLPADFEFVPFNDEAALEARMDATVAAVIVEPVQGESGVHVASDAFLRAARRLCDEHDALLIFDEVQCGIGRIGSLFAFESFRLVPDVVTLAKALANGVPIGALLAGARAADGFEPGDHGSTFGGSPLAAAAALAHLRVRDAMDLDAHVARRSSQLFAALGDLVSRSPTIFGPPRGKGLLIGVPVLEPYESRRSRSPCSQARVAAGDRGRQHDSFRAAAYRLGERDRTSGCDLGRRYEHAGTAGDALAGFTIGFTFPQFLRECNSCRIQHPATLQYGFSTRAIWTSQDPAMGRRSPHLPDLDLHSARNRRNEGI